MQFLKNSAKVARKCQLLAFSWAFFGDLHCSWSGKETVIPDWNVCKTTKFSFKKPWPPVAILQNLKWVKFWKIFRSISIFTSIKPTYNSCHQKNCMISSSSYLLYFQPLWWRVCSFYRSCSFIIGDRSKDLVSWGQWKTKICLNFKFLDGQVRPRNSRGSNSPPSLAHLKL